MREGDFHAARDVLERGHRSRLASGHTHFQNSYLLDVLAWLEQQPLEPIDGLNLERELQRLIDSPDQRMCGVAHRVPSGSKDGVGGHRAH